MFDDDFEELDDGLSQMIKKGKKIKFKLEQEYKNGSFVAYYVDDPKNYKIRKLMITIKG